MAKIKDKKLVLRTGEVFTGSSFGADVAKVCTLVYNTSMFAYQDIICDPASAGLMVMMTYPVIGSVGIVSDEASTEGLVPAVGGLVVREYNDLPSNFRSRGTLSGLLRLHGIPAIEGVDTRSLTRLVRDRGEVEAVIVDIDTPDEEAIAFIRSAVKDDTMKFVGERRRVGDPESPVRIALIDCGAKAGIAEGFAARGCAVTVLHADETAEEIAGFKPHGVVVAGGAGDPRTASHVIETIRKLTGRFPVFGIGTGFCMAVLSRGGSVERMKDGHRGANRPMRWLESGKINVSSRNYGWAPVEDSLAPAGMTVLCRDLMDGTVTAAADRENRIFGTLHYPELCADTQDSDRLAAEFIEMIKEGGANA